MPAVNRIWSGAGQSRSRRFLVSIRFCREGQVSFEGFLPIASTAVGQAARSPPPAAGEAGRIFGLFHYVNRKELPERVQSALFD